MDPVWFEGVAGRATEGNVDRAPKRLRCSVVVYINRRPQYRPQDAKPQILKPKSLDPKP